MDEEVALFWLLRETSALRDEHLIRQILRCNMLGAVGLLPLDGRERSAFAPTMNAWQRQLLLRGGNSINSLVLGERGFGRGSDHRSAESQLLPQEFHDHVNLNGLERRALKHRGKEAAPMENGVVLTDLLANLAASSQLDALAIKTDLSEVHLKTAASDGIATAPALEIDVKQLRFVGQDGEAQTAEQLENLDDATRRSVLTKLSSSMIEYFTISLGGSRALEMPIALFSSGSTGGVEAVKSRHEKFEDGLICSECAVDELTGKACECKDGCPFNKCVIAHTKEVEHSLCDGCRALGVKSALALERPCSACISKLARAAHGSEGTTVPASAAIKLKCVRIHCVFLASDQESKEASFMAWLEKNREDLFPVPDGVHLLKTVRSGVYWWWLFVGDDIVSMRLIMVLRASRDAAVQRVIFAAVSAAALTNRDRMNVESAVEILSFELCDAIPKGKRLLVTIYPEVWTPLTRDCPASAVGCISGITCMPSGCTMFISDSANAKIFMARLRCPIQLTEVAGGSDRGREDGFGGNAKFTLPAGLVYRDMGKTGHFVFVADAAQSSLRAIDVGPVLNRAHKVYEGDGDDEAFAAQAAPGDDAVVKHNKLACVSTIQLADDASAPSHLTQPFAMCDASDSLDDALRVRLFVTDLATRSVVRVSVAKIEGTGDERRVAFRAITKIESKLPAGFAPRSITYDALSKLLFVGDAAKGQVAIIDTAATADARIVAVPFVQSVRSVLCCRTAAKFELLLATGHALGRADNDEGAVHGLLRLDVGTETRFAEINFTISASGDDASRSWLIGGSAVDPLDARHDDIANLATTYQPSCLCAATATSFIFADNKQSIRLLTGTTGLVRFLSVHKGFAAAIGLLEECDALRWDDALQALEAVVGFHDEMENQARHRTGKAPSSINGPEGASSAPTRNGFRMFLRSVKRARSWLLHTYGIDVANTVSWPQLLELACERHFGRIRCGPTGSATVLTDKGYRERRVDVIDVALETRFNDQGYSPFTGKGRKYYPDPPGVAARIGSTLTALYEFVRGLPASARVQEVASMPQEEWRRLYEKMRSWKATHAGPKARQESTRVKTMWKPGTMPNEALLRQPNNHTASSTVDLSELADGTAARRQGAQARAVVTLAFKKDTFVACLGRGQLQAAGRGNTSDPFDFSKCWLARVDADIFTEDGSFVDETFSADWLILSLGESSLYEYEYSVARTADPRAIMSSVDLQIEGDPDGSGRHKYRLSDEEYRRLSQLGQAAEEQTAEETLRQEAAERRAVEDARTALAQAREAVPRNSGKRAASTVAGGVAALLGKRPAPSADRGGGGNRGGGTPRGGGRSKSRGRSSRG